MPIELLTSPGCPNAKAARKVVTDCLTTLGIDVPIIDRVGRYPSPTVLVDGVDVMRPEAAGADRRYVPTRHAHPATRSRRTAERASAMAESEGRSTTVRSTTVRRRAGGSDARS